MYKKHPAIFTGTVLSDTRCSFIKSTNKRDRAYVYVYVHHSSAPLSIMFSLSFDRFSFHKLAKETFPISRYEHRVNLRSFPSSLFLFLSFFFFLMKKQLLDNGNAGLDYSMRVLSPLLLSLQFSEMTNQSRNVLSFFFVPKEEQGSIVSKTGGVRFAKRFQQKRDPFLKRGRRGKSSFDGIGERRGEGREKKKVERRVGPVIDGRRSKNA